MKGLLLKDFYMSWRYCRAVLIIAVVFLAVSCMGNDNFFFRIYPVVLSSIIPISLIAYDERDKWLEYSNTLPYTRAQLVSVKYLVGLSVEVGIFVLTVGVTVVQMQLNGSFSWEELVAIGGALLMLGCLAPACMLPFVFKYGVEKGRIAYYIILGVLSTATMGGVGAGLHWTNSLWPLAVMAGVALALYTLSWVLSIRFYQKREF